MGECPDDESELSAGGFIMTGKSNSSADFPAFSVLVLRPYR